MQYKSCDMVECMGEVKFVVVVIATWVDLG
jgi:hypothetical protein